MATSEPGTPTEPPPLGSWAATYAVACGLAIVVMALLWWFTNHYQIPLGRP